MRGVQTCALPISFHPSQPGAGTKHPPPTRGAGTEPLPTAALSSKETWHTEPHQRKVCQSSQFPRDMRSQRMPSKAPPAPWQASAGTIAECGNIANPPKGGLVQTLHSEMHQPAFQTLDHSLRPIGHIQPHKNDADMRFDGRFLDRKLFRNLTIALRSEEHTSELQSLRP